jgi:hypothetical protein
MFVDLMICYFMIFRSPGVVTSPANYMLGCATFNPTLGIHTLMGALFI